MTMVINVHAGHNPDGKVACGACGLLKESTEARKVKNYLISMLREHGHIVYDCTVDDGVSRADILRRIVEKCNAHKVDLDISIHFNAGAFHDPNDATTGTEDFVLSGSTVLATAKRICEAISSLGFKNRGTKTGNNLYVLIHTNAPAILVECCFVDDPDDAAIYDAKKMAEAVYKGITGEAYKPAAVAAAPAAKAATYKIATKGARLALRSAAGTTSKLIMYVKNGTKVTGTGKTQTVKNVKWVQVKVDGKCGWMHGGYLKKVA